jgi:membrane associated rhomboid family serine protease
MRYYYSEQRIGLGGRMTPMVRALIIVSIIVFLFQLISRMDIYRIFGLVPTLVWGKLALWQLASYLFLHGGFFHLFFNMFALWMFGSELERYFGSNRFLRYYFITGIGAGITVVLTTPHSAIPTIGASGAIYGILLAYGLIFPNRYVYLYFIFPIKAKHLVLLFTALELFATWGYAADGIAHFAHLGGMLFGYLYFKRFFIGGISRRIRNYFYFRKLKREFDLTDRSRRFH